MIDNLTFKQPMLFYLFLVIPIMVIWYVVSKRKKNPAAIRISLGGLYKRPPVSLRQRFIHLPLVFRLLCVSMVILVLARPQVPKSWREIETEGIDIVLTMDISTSMLAKDFEVNRLEASKDVAKEFVIQRKNDRIGLVLFSGKSFTQFPLTTDHEVLIKLLEQAQAGMITDGTAIGLGLANAVRNLRNSFSKNKVIILLTDGVNNEESIDPIEAGKMAQDLGIRVYAIDIRESADLMEKSAEEDSGGDVLKDVASMTGGRYFTSTDKEGLRKVYEEIDKMEKSRINAKDIGTRDAFMLFALLAVVFLLLEILMANTVLKTIP